MVNLRFQISYLGYGYHGWARQPNNIKTIQETIESELNILFNQKIAIYGSGRTDKFVHANNQYFSFKINECKIPLCHLKEVLNKKFKKRNIFIKDIKIVDENFNARYSAISKTYKYLINTAEFDLKQNDLVYQYNKKLNLKKMKKISKLFLGKHNFLSFSTSELEDTIRTINYIKINRKKQIVIILINGDGFLRSMVRMIVASMIKYSENQITQQNIISLLNNPQKGASIEKINACGLYLEEVNYDKI